MTPETAAMWAEYDSAAEWCAKRGIKGEQGDALPPLISTDCHDAINADPDAFMQRVRATAYARAMRRKGHAPMGPVVRTKRP